MPRRQRFGLQGAAFHVMNRAVRRTILFETHRDYDAFITVLLESLARFKVQIISFQLMPNHWHFVTICDWIEEISNWMHLKIKTSDGREAEYSIFISNQNTFVREFPDQNHQVKNSEQTQAKVVINIPKIEALRSSESQPSIRAAVFAD